jgi:hypothetical protein
MRDTTSAVALGLKCWTWYGSCLSGCVVQWVVLSRQHYSVPRGNLGVTYHRQVAAILQVNAISEAAALWHMILR